MPARRARRTWSSTPPARRASPGDDRHHGQPHPLRPAAAWPRVPAGRHPAAAAGHPLRLAAAPLPGRPRVANRAHGPGQRRGRQRLGGALDERRRLVARADPGRRRAARRLLQRRRGRRVGHLRARRLERLGGARTGRARARQRDAHAVPDLVPRQPAARGRRQRHRDRLRRLERPDRLPDGAADGEHPPARLSGRPRRPSSPARAPRRAPS